MTASTPNYLTIARDRWPKAEWIDGRGRFGLVAHCRVVTVMLFETQAIADSAKARIDRLGCGGFCVRTHEIVRLV